VYLIQRKIFWQIIKQTALVYVFVAFIGATTQVLHQLYRMIDASSDLWVVAKFFLYMSPMITVSVLPLAFLIACMNAFDRMDENREAVIVMSAGSHPGFVLLPAALVALICSAIIFTLAIAVEPHANRKEYDTTNSLTLDAFKLIAGNGVLQEVDPGVFMRGGGFNEEGLIDGLFILDRRDSGEETSYFAELGEIIEEEGERPYIKLINGTIQIRDTSVGSVYRFNYDTYTAQAEDFIGGGSRRSYEARTTGTLDLIDMLAAEQKPYSEQSIRKELLRRATEGLYPLVLFAVCAFLVLRSGFTREVPAWRMFVAIMIGFVTKAIGQTLLTGAGSSNTAAVASIAFPLIATVLFLSAGLRRATGRTSRGASVGLSDVLARLRRSDVRGQPAR
jgi:lipopolysaccharide export system permease protein